MNALQHGKWKMDLAPFNIQGTISLPHFRQPEEHFYTANTVLSGIEQYVRLHFVLACLHDELAEDLFRHSSAPLYTCRHHGRHHPTSLPVHWLP